MCAARLVAVGDLQLGDSAICAGFGYRSRAPGQEDLSRLLAEVRPIAEGADIVFGNLECQLSDAGADPGRLESIQMRGSPGFAPVLRQLGFNVLNVANNHAMQHGTAAFQESVDTLRKAGIQPCGIRGSDGWASEPVRIRCSDDSSAGVLAYCLRPRQYGDTEPLYAEGDAASICADVARLSREVDTVIVSLHWGEEFVPAPSRSEVALGDAILNAGAAVILGHHPHVARPVTATDSRVIAFSLGNFAADMIWQEPLRHGLLLECTLQSGAVTGTRVLRTHIEDSLATRITTVELPLTPYGEVHALPEPAYADEIARTIGSQRLAAYRFALGNVHRYGRGMFRQMIGTTLLNKFRRSSP